MFTDNSTTRRAAPALFFVLTLAFAVCFWGLHYKLSLYHAGATQTANPAAKLLSQKERPASSVNLDSMRQPQTSTLFTMFLIAAFAAVSALVLHWICTLIEDPDNPQQNHAGPSCLLPRPPPASLLPR